MKQTYLKLIKNVLNYYKLIKLIYKLLVCK